MELVYMHQTHRPQYSDAYNNIEMMLTVALQFWEVASYSSFSAGYLGTNRNWTNANKCKDLELMQKHLNEVTELCLWKCVDEL